MDTDLLLAGHTVAVIGGRGMLGRDLTPLLEDAGARALVLDVPEFDLRDDATVRAALPPAAVVVNCAAYTRVDDAEHERATALAVNAEGAGRLAAVCAARGVPLVQLSTDYVFDGRGGRPYLEGDPVAPLNYYGVTKLEGERRVQAAGGPHLIVRTQSLFGVHGRSFAASILHQLRAGRTVLKVVQDQVSAPTFTGHLAQALLRLIAAGARGVVHVASRTGCSWHRFAEAIVERAGVAAEVQPIAAATLALPATRPAYSVLDTSHYTRLTGHRMPTWEEALDAYLAEEPRAGLPPA